MLTLIHFPENEKFASLQGNVDRKCFTTTCDNPIIYKLITTSQREVGRDDQTMQTIVQQVTN